MDHNLFTCGERIHFNYIKTSHYVTTHTQEGKSPALAGYKQGLHFELD